MNISMTIRQAVIITIISLFCFVGLAQANYSPVQGRWLERDPAGYVDGMNRYQEAHSAPTGFIDPYGLQDRKVPETKPADEPEEQEEPAEPEKPERPEGPSLDPINPLMPGWRSCTLKKCNRDSDLLLGKHGYLLLCCIEARGSVLVKNCQSCGVFRSSGSTQDEDHDRRYPWDNPKDRGKKSKGKRKHKCKTIAEDGILGKPNPDIDAIWNCCIVHKGEVPGGLWIPLLNDCHNPIDDCIKKIGKEPPPGIGRW